MKKILLTTTIIAALVIIGLLIFLNNRGTQLTADQSGGVSNVNSNSATTTGQTKEFNIIAKNWVFEPSQIEVNKGDTVILHVKSIDVAHGIAISQFNVNQRLEPNKEETVTFVADVSGTYPFYCNVFCGEGHRSMKGSLIVN